MCDWLVSFYINIYASIYIQLQWFIVSYDFYVLVLCYTNIRGQNEKKGKKKTRISSKYGALNWLSIDQGPSGRKVWIKNLDRLRKDSIDCEVSW